MGNYYIASVFKPRSSSEDKHDALLIDGRG
jgi:hypothetical protein